MTLATDERHKVSGSAVITLNSGRSLPFTVRGVFNPRTEISKLTLLGVDTAKGSSLVVSVDGNTVKTIKGRISGQSVYASYQ